MQRVITAVALALAVGSLCGAASAAEPELSVRQACKADFKTFCAKAPMLGGGAMRCMRAHASELSDTCRQAWAAHHKAADAPASNQVESSPRS